MPPKGKQTNEKEPPDARQQQQGPEPSPPPDPTSQEIVAREGSTVSDVMQVAGDLVEGDKIVYSPLSDLLRRRALVRGVFIAGGLLVIFIFIVIVIVWAQFRSLPTAYAEFVLDNSQLQDPHQLNQLADVLYEELARSLPDAALALRVFGENCGQTRQLVNFSRGNAPKLAEELEEVQPVPYADVMEAIRQALNDVLKKPADRPRIVVAVTWGRDDCGHDLNEALEAYEEQLGDDVSLFVYSFETPIAVSQRGVQSSFFPDSAQLRPELERIVGALEVGEVPVIIPPILPDVRIGEILCDPPGPDVDGEYVLIHNYGGTVDMTDWTLSDEANHTYAFPTFTLGSGASVRVWTKSGTDTATDLYWGSVSAIWNNTGDTAYLRDDLGNPIDTFSY